MLLAINRASRILVPSMLALLVCAAPGPSGRAWALSEIQREELTAPGMKAPADPAAPSATPQVPETEAPETATPSDEGDDGEEASPADPNTPKDPNRPTIDEDGPLPTVEYDLMKLPEPVRRMHDLLIEACKSGEVERLRTLIGTGEDATQVSLGGLDGDVIDFLKSSSGDGEGYEILAILQEILSAGYVHLDAGKPEELYVWPYFFAVPIDRLDGKQKVELFKIITAGDFEEMKSYGAYVFYRVGITPLGEWAFFLAGD